MNVFLSASIPLPGRDAVYLETADVFAIREAVKGLVLVLLETNARLIFGGHPAITPLVRLLVNGAERNVNDHVTLYQSRFFQKEFPPENAAFEGRIIVDAIGDRIKSLAEMRRRMIGENDFACGVFIGGMEGVIDEYNMFRTMKPEAPAYPIASTGAAAAMLFNQMEGPPAELKMELTYPTLFRKLLRR